MSVVGVIALVIIAAFLILAVYCMVAINRPMTKEEEAAKFKQDCEDFDKYVGNKRKEK